ncbi:MAG: IclR family transcriptional regulator [Geobacteraceae bacterium]|nr:IclR family transcriptional regulator [Geobacteraceae bacterium]NTW81423.1 IclR family transcriptional regulator [Geobacteraceae bacterium]
MAQKTGAYTVQTVQKAFEILEYLTEDRAVATHKSIALKFEMSPNKTFRLLATLCESGLVEQDISTGNFRLGINSFSLAQKLAGNSNIISIAHPVIVQLAKKHDEAVYMTIIKGDDVLFLDMADCHQQIKAESLVGKSFPYFTNAAGKVMKALESAEVIEWLKSKKYGKSRNIPNSDFLASELLEIRSNGGVAIDSGGLGEGLISVAVAVKDYAGHVIGAITMHGPSFRLVRERIEREIIPSLLEAAALASQRFGYMPA